MLGFMAAAGECRPLHADSRGSAADKDNNGYLDKMQAQQSPIYRNIFAMVDCDGDGEVFEKKVVA